MFTCCKTRAIATINVAPWVIPITDGSAIGFLVIPCIIAPDTAKNPPTKTPARALGILTSLIILEFISFPFPNTLFTIVEKSISFAPIDTDKNIPRDNNINPQTTKIYEFLLFELVKFVPPFLNFLIYLLKSN